MGGRTRSGRCSASRSEAGTPEQFVFHWGRDETKGLSKHFTDAYGTPNRLNRRSTCSSNRRVPLMSFYGREFEGESRDFAPTQMLLDFGANPMEAHQGGQHIRKRSMDARVDGGARLVTFAVRPSATASASDEYFAVNPGVKRHPFLRIEATPSVTRCRRSQGRRLEVARRAALLGAANSSDGSMGLGGEYRNDGTLSRQRGATSGE